MKKTLLLTLLTLWICMIPIMGQNLRLPISTYTNKVYGRDYEATNYCILTDHRNLVYAGNANGIMEYDGTEWRFIEVRQGAYVTSMALAPNGTIYIGAEQEFGLLLTNQRGSLEYRSLSQLLPDKDRYFSDIWSTHANKNLTAFQAEECMYILRGDSIQSIYPNTTFHTSFLLGSNLYVRERGEGLKILQDDTFHLVKDGEKFTDLGIFGMFPYDDKGRILLATKEKGFYLFDPLRGIEHMPTDNESFLIDADIFGGIALSDSNFALNTLHEGVVICNRDGKIRAVINKSTGLNSDDVKGIWQDKYQNIWCALENGIDKIDYTSPLSFYQEESGLEGNVNTLVRFEGKLYVGTTSGLFVEENSEVLNKTLKFTPVLLIKDQVWSLKSIHGSLVVGTSNGLFTVKNDRARKISDINVFTLYYSEKENRLLAGGSGGLTIFQPDLDWKLISHISEIKMDIKAIAQNRLTSHDATEIWLGSSQQGCMKILVYDDLSYDISQYYGAADGLPEGWILPFTFQDSVVFGTQDGGFQFIDETTIKAMLPDSLKDIPEYSRGYFQILGLYNVRNDLPLSFVIHSYKRTWAVVNNEITLVHHLDGSNIFEKPFRMVDLGEINSIYPDDENTVWFAASDGLARFDLENMNRHVSDLYAAIRSIVISGDSLIFNGSHMLPQYSSEYDPVILFEQPLDAVPVLDYEFNDLTFFFTSPFYDNEEDNMFSWMLDGDKSGWSSWSDRRVTSYTNLHEGEYIFMLRMKNVYGDITEPTGYRFIILPPWYRTIPAYLSYIFILTLFIYTTIRLGQRRLKLKNEKLEATVLERTEEIRHQNVELAAQKKEITDSIYYAERIQRAILPHTERIAENIEGYFILFKPKDIVSGDFYWLAETGNKIIITAADCTGHGVPGAFMSMLGVSFLNKIILENNTLEADAILNHLRDNVISALKQTGKEGEARDGMDMSLVVIDLAGMTMEFSGANNPLYMIREDELKETKADRMPIAFQIETAGFSNHKIELKKGDTFYLFTDGYADQFGGAKGKKLMYKPFKRLLTENRDKSMEEIHRILDDTIENWKAPDGPEGEIYEQVDDILVMGIRI